MLHLPSQEVFEERYTKYAERNLVLIKKKYQDIPSDIGIKLQHGISMMSAVEKATMESGFFNESYYLSSALEGCGHDIGRFPQYLLTGTLKDADSETITGSKDHGNFARKILLANNQTLLRYFLGEKSPYDRVFTEVIGEHTKIRNPLYQYSISELVNLFQNYSLEEILKAKEPSIKNKLITLKLAILQEMDCLELLQNVMSEAWIPAISCKKEFYAHPDIWDDFMHFRYIDITKYRREGKWTSNAGFLLRYGLLARQMKLVCTLKEFTIDEGFQKVWDKTLKHMKDKEVGEIDPLLLQAQEYAILMVDNLIKTSPDGILLTERSKEKAKQLTLEEWKKRY